MAYIPETDKMVVKGDGFRMLIGQWERNHFCPSDELISPSPYPILRTFLELLDKGEVESRGVELPIEAIRVIVEAFDEQREWVKAHGGK